MPGFLFAPVFLTYFCNRFTRQSMQKALATFLKAALVLALFLLVVSIVFVTKSREELDPDSMMMAMLLLVFSSLGSLVISIVLFKMRGK